jgi:hypothetical protein
LGRDHSARMASPPSDMEFHRTPSPGRHQSESRRKTLHSPWTAPRVRKKGRSSPSAHPQEIKEDAGNEQEMSESTLPIQFLVLGGQRRLSVANVFGEAHMAIHKTRQLQYDFLNTSIQLVIQLKRNFSNLPGPILGVLTTICGNRCNKWV